MSGHPLDSRGPLVYGQRGGSVVSERPMNLNPIPTPGIVRAMEAHFEQLRKNKQSSPESEPRQSPGDVDDEARDEIHRPSLKRQRDSSQQQQRSKPSRRLNREYRPTGHIQLMRSNLPPVLEDDDLVSAFGDEHDNEMNAHAAAAGGEGDDVGVNRADEAGIDDEEEEEEENDNKSHASLQNDDAHDASQIKFAQQLALLNKRHKNQKEMLVFKLKQEEKFKNKKASSANDEFHSMPRLTDEQTNILDIPAIQALYEFVLVLSGIDPPNPTYKLTPEKHMADCFKRFWNGDSQSPLYRKGIEQANDVTPFNLEMYFHLYVGPSVRHAIHHALQTIRSFQQPIRNEHLFVLLSEPVLSTPFSEYVIACMNQPRSIPTFRGSKAGIQWMASTAEHAIATLKAMRQNENGEWFKKE